MKKLLIVSALTAIGVLNQAHAMAPVRTRDNSVVTEKSRKEINAEPEALTAEDYEDAGYQDLNPAQCEVMRQYTLHILNKLIVSSNLQKYTQDFYLKFKCWLDYRSATGAQVGNATLEFEPGYYGALESEDAVASVLAHEISHHLLKHEHLLHHLNEEYVAKSRRGSLTDDDEATRFAKYRTYESEADLNMVPMLMNAGYSVAGALDMNATMNDRDKDHKTHPTPNQRRSMLLAESARLGANIKAPVRPFPPIVLKAIEEYFAKKTTETRAPVKNQRDKVLK